MDDIYGDLLALADDEEDIDFEILQAENADDVSLGAIMSYYSED